MREGARRADVVAATIFVNPTQFGPKEDLSRYPRDLEGDLRKCAQRGRGRGLRPRGRGRCTRPATRPTWRSTERQQGLCGARRPGHFRGVATVVTKLFALFRPARGAVRREGLPAAAGHPRARARPAPGRRDRRACPPCAKPDGLAMSSRNTYLSRRRARSGRSRSSGGCRRRRRCAAAASATRETLLDGGPRRARAGEVREDYVELVDAETLEPHRALAAGRRRGCWWRPSSARPGSSTTWPSAVWRRPPHGAEAKPRASVKVVAENRGARFDYTVEETLEAACALGQRGEEPARRRPSTSPTPTRCPKGSELFLLNAHIGAVQARPASSPTSPPARRKLLLHREEIDRWAAKCANGVIPSSRSCSTSRRAGPRWSWAVRGKTHEDRRAGHQGAGDQARDGSGDAPPLDVELGMDDGQARLREEGPAARRPGRAW